MIVNDEALLRRMLYQIADEKMRYKGRLNKVAERLNKEYKENSNE